jgi:hypothetical protein
MNQPIPHERNRESLLAINLTIGAQKQSPFKSDGNIQIKALSAGFAN